MISEVMRWVLPPLSSSWIIIIIWLYIALNRTPNVDCYWGGCTQLIYFTQHVGLEGRDFLRPCRPSGSRFCFFWFLNLLEGHSGVGIWAAWVCSLGQNLSPKPGSLAAWALRGLSSCRPASIMVGIMPRGLRYPKEKGFSGTKGHSDCRTWSLKPYPNEGYQRPLRL